MSTIRKIENSHHGFSENTWEAIDSADDMKDIDFDFDIFAFIAIITKHNVNISEFNRWLNSRTLEQLYALINEIDISYYDDDHNYDVLINLISVRFSEHDGHEVDWNILLKLPKQFLVRIIKVLTFVDRADYE